jgi:predicted nucleic acid-binding protein
MNGIDLIADTNALIYLLAGRKEAEVLNGYSIGISVITELELLSKQGMKAEELEIIKNLINNCYVIGIENTTKEVFRSLRQRHQLKLPDAVIAATALDTGIPLVTADKRFSIIEELNLVQIFLEYKHHSALIVVSGISN